MKIGPLLALVVSAAGLLAASPSRSVLGTIVGFRTEAAAIEVRPDQGAPIFVTAAPATVVQRVAPGDKDLRQAETIRITDLAIGDRVLVTLAPTGTDAVRIVVMSASDIAKRHEAERLDWLQRGAAGIVASIQGRQILLKQRSLRGETLLIVEVGPDTVVRRYAPDSVRFADARPSQVSEIRPGDQLRARGVTSPDATRLNAQELVFGTFLIKAGTITAIRPDAGELTIQERGSNKTLIIRLTPDSQVRRMPDFPFGPPGSRPATGPPRPEGAGPMGRSAGASPGFGPPAQPGGPPDFSQMLERMPAATLADMAPGETVVVSSTLGASAQQVTAIVLLANAERLLQMAAMQARPDGPAQGPGVSIGGMMGAGGFELPGMIP